MGEYIGEYMGAYGDDDGVDEILRFPSLSVLIATLMTDSEVAAKIGLPVALKLHVIGV